MGVSDFGLTVGALGARRRTSLWLAALPRSCRDPLTTSSSAISARPGFFAQTLRDVDALRGPMITMFHGYDISLYVQQHGPGVYKHLFARGDLFTCPSEFVRKRLITAGCPAEKVQRFKLGTDLQRFSFKERTLDSSGAIRLVTVARLTEKKGLEYSIRAVAKLSQRFAKLEYNIIGH